MATDVCSADGCSKPRRCRGLCNAHYLKLKRKGLGPRLQGGPERNTLASVLNRTTRDGDCLVWTGSTTPLGYGYISIKGQLRRVHVVAWELTNGPVPDGMEVDHTCWNRACVNINHLRLATRAQNNANLNGPRKSNRSTGVRNVYPNRNGYRVAISHKGKQLSFGTYPTIEEASRVAEQKRREVFGQFAGRG